MDSVSPSTNLHREQSKKRVGVSILTVSDTRTLETDLGGKLIEELSIAAGFHIVEREIVIDDRNLIQSRALSLLAITECEALLITGGTGLAERDCTVDAIEPLYEGTIPGYGELFRMLSYQEIGPASMLSRASAGRIGPKVIFTMPGSMAGVRLAMEKLIVPELAHVVFHAGK